MIFTHCRMCLEPVLANGLGKQELTCESCGAQFVFGEGPLYLAPPPGADPETAVYELTMKDGSKVRLHPELPPRPGEAAAVPGDYPARLGELQKRAVIVEIADKARPRLLAEGAIDGDFPDFMLLLNVARDLLEAEARGDLGAMLSQYQVTVPLAAPDPVPDPAAHADDIARISNPEWTPVETDAFKAAALMLYTFADMGRPVGPRDVDLERAYQLALHERRAEAAADGEAEVPDEELPPVSEIFEGLFRATGSKDAAATAAHARVLEEIQRRADAGQHLPDETPTAPMPRAESAPTVPQKDAGGWVIFAVGFVIVMLAFPIAHMFEMAHEMLGTLAMLALLVAGARGMYSGLRQAIGTAPIVTGILVFFAIGPAMGVGLAGMGALGLNPFGETSESAGAAANETGAANASD